MSNTNWSTSLLVFSMAWFSPLILLTLPKSPSACKIFTKPLPWDNQVKKARSSDFVKICTITKKNIDTIFTRSGHGTSSTHRSRHNQPQRAPRLLFNLRAALAGKKLQHRRHNPPPCHQPHCHSNPHPHHPHHKRWDQGSNSTHGRWE